MAGNKLNIDPNEFQNLTKQIADAIGAGMKQGAEKGKKAFGGADLLSEMKSQLDEIGKAEKANNFAAQVKNKMLNEGISSQRAEVQILAQQQIAKNNLVKKAAEENMLQMGLLKLQAQQAGNTDLVKHYDNRIQKSQEFVKGIENENNAIKGTSKLIDKKLKQQDEEKESIKTQNEINDKFKEINKTLKERIGITEEVIDQLRTPEMAKAVFFQQMVSKGEQVLETFEKLDQSGLSLGQRVDYMRKSFSMMSVMGLSDTKGVLDGMVESYGTLNAMTEDQVDHVGHLAKQMGVSGQEAFGMVDAFSKMPGETMETAANTADFVNNLAKANGIAPGKTSCC